MRMLIAVSIVVLAVAGGLATVPVAAQAAEGVSPLSVSELQVTATIPGRLNLSWKGDEKTRPIYYHIHRSPTPGFTPGKDNLVAEVPSTRFLDWGLKYPVIPRLGHGSPGGLTEKDSMFSYTIKEATTYYYRVVAGDKDGNEGKPSNEAGCRTMVSPKLAAPEAMGPTDVSDDQVWKRRDITINGTINIKPGGSLTIDASKITFNSTERDKWGILIWAPTKDKPGGRLLIKNGSFITAAKKGFHWWVYTLQQFHKYTRHPVVRVKDSRFSRLGIGKYHAPSMGSDKRNTGQGFHFMGEISSKTYFSGNEFFECRRAISGSGPKVIDNTFHNFVGRTSAVYTRGNSLIENNRFRGIRFAIYSAQRAHNLTIKDNTFDRITLYTIDLFGPTENLKAVNNIIRDSWKCFVLIPPFKNCLLEGNTFTNSYGCLTGAANNSVVRNNVVDTVDDGYPTGSHSTYENNRVSRASVGMGLFGSHSVLRGNKFLNARRGNYGVRNWRWRRIRRLVPKNSGSHNLVVDTVISDCPYGLSLLYGKENVFRDLKISGSKVVDIHLLGCNEGTKFINVKYSTVKINDKAEVIMPPWKVKHKIADFKPDQFLVYYYLDVKVVDKNGRPVPGAQVTVENVTQPGLSAINMLGQTKKEFVTGPNGHTLLPTDEKNSAAILGFKQTSSLKVKMTHRITASKADGSGRKRTSSVNGLSPDESWYRKQSDRYQKTIVIDLLFAQ